MAPPPKVSMPDRNELFPQREYSQPLLVALTANGDTLARLAPLHPYKSKGPQPDQNRSLHSRGQTTAQSKNVQDGDTNQLKSQKIQCRAGCKTGALAPLASYLPDQSGRNNTEA